MSFGWINLINALAVICLILINIIAMKKNIAGDFNSRYRIINVLEQVGRYGCMAMMIIDIAIKYGYDPQIVLQKHSTAFMVILPLL